MAELKHIIFVVSGEDDKLSAVASKELIDYNSELPVIAVEWVECTSREEVHRLVDEALDQLEALPETKEPEHAN